uniref:Uncharacterized protein n=1 Tax=Trichobilharzia regenti TaxID=157069 RepID=A0AA85J0M7_TRIRE|nr:unnamed protein product [Trichobilharzia regenti]
MSCICTESFLLHVMNHDSVINFSRSTPTSITFENFDSVPPTPLCGCVMMHAVRLPSFSQNYSSSREVSTILTLAKFLCSDNLTTPDLLV